MDIQGNIPTELMPKVQEQLIEEKLGPAREARHSKQRVEPAAAEEEKKEVQREEALTRPLLRVKMAQLISLLTAKIRKFPVREIMLHVFRGVA
jgi:hypothetical protein